MWGALAAVGSAIVSSVFTKKGADAAEQATRAGEAAKLDYMKQALDAYQASTDKQIAMGQESTDKAIQARREGTTQAKDLVMEMMQIGLDEYAPYKEAGLEALEAIKKDVAAPMGESALYKWQQAEGQKAIDMAFAARQGFGSGAAVQAQSDFQNQLGANETAIRRTQLNKLADYGYGAAGAGANLTQAAGQSIAGMDVNQAQDIASLYESQGVNAQNAFGKLGQYQAALLEGMGGVKQQTQESLGQIKTDEYAEYSKIAGNIGSGVLTYQKLFDTNKKKKTTGGTE